jgi:hypothetical protein
MVVWDDDDDDDDYYYYYYLTEGQIKEISNFFLTLLYNTVKITCELNLRYVSCHPYCEGFVPPQQLLLD